MPRVIDRRSFLASVSGGAVAGLAGCTSVFGRSPATDGPPRLHVDGRWLRDPDGSPVVPRGVTVPDPVWGRSHESERGKGYWDALRLATDGEEGWYARILRLPVTPQSVGRVGLDALVREYVDPAVDLAAERDAYILLDYHAVQRYDTPSADRQVRAFWDRVAPRYAGDQHVCYELFAEPTGPAGRGIESWRTWREHARPWAELVRDHAPETPIVLGSPRRSTATAHAATEPFDVENVLYAARLDPTWEPGTWEDAFGTPALSVPVFVTEWGYGGTDSAPAYRAGRTSEWGEPLRDWLDAHENVGWCVATFDSTRPPALFDDDWSVQGGERHAGALAKEWLAARRDDHRPGGDTDVENGPGLPPGRPRSLSVREARQTSATIAWMPPTDPDGDDVLQYRVRVGDREPVALSRHETEYSVWDLEAGSKYVVEVTAVDRRGRTSEPARTALLTPSRSDVQATIPRTPEPPTLEADELPPRRRAVHKYLWGPQPVGVDVEWYGAWNDDALYLFADAREVAPEGETVVEVFLDLDHSGGRAYDGENDVHLFLYPDSSTPVLGTHSATPSGGTTYESIRTNEGWRAALVFPWSDYGLDPAVGQRIGLDVHAFREHDGDRVAGLAWFDSSDTAYEEPARMATVELGE